MTYTLLELMDDKVLEKEFRRQLKLGGLSRSSLPKPLYRALLKDFKDGMRQTVMERARSGQEERRQ